MMYALIDNVKDESSLIRIYFSRPSYLLISGRGLLLKVTWGEVLDIYQYQGFRLGELTKWRIERRAMKEYLAGKSRPQKQFRHHTKQSSAWTTRIASYIPTFFI